MSTEGSVQKGQLITLDDDGTLTVPDNPIVVSIEGDGIGCRNKPYRSCAKA